MPNARIVSAGWVAGLLLFNQLGASAVAETDLVDRVFENADAAPVANDDAEATPDVSGDAQDDPSEDVQAANVDNGQVTQTFDLRDFNAVKAAGVYTLNVEVGPEFGVTLSGPAREMSFVEVSVADGALILDQDEAANAISNRQSVTATVTLPALTGLAVAGVVNADVKGVAADAFTAKLSGVGDVRIGGTCGNLRAAISGVGDFNGRDLVCRAADLSVSGVGDAAVFADESVDVAVSGMGSVDVYGEPDEVQKTGGMFAKIRIK
ncbi:MAG: head GIN domain-containing protein [Pseudomonadota bacterium]